MSKRSVVALLVACAAPAHAFVPAGRRSLPRTSAAGVERHELALAAVRRSAQPQMAAAAVATRLGAGGLSLASLTRPVVAVAAALLVVIAWAFKRLNTPSRVYDREANSVGREYDAWTSEVSTRASTGWLTTHYLLAPYSLLPITHCVYSPLTTHHSLLTRASSSTTGASTSTWATTRRGSVRRPCTAARTLSRRSTTSSTACSTSLRRRRAAARAGRLLCGDTCPCAVLELPSRPIRVGAEQGARRRLRDRRH